MRKGTKIALFCALFGLFTLGVIGFGIWRATAKPPVQAVVTPAGGPSSLSVSNNAGLGGGTEAPAAVSEQSASPVAKPTTTTTTGPESFSKYEQYKDNKTALFSDTVVGTGKELTAGKKAAVVYKVWLTNGTLVDESKLDKPGGKLQAFVFTLGDHTVIPGWEQGIFGMKVNGTRRMIIPAALAYGAQGQAGTVPPNSMLVIDVQLVQVE
jgi:FKBP-type peptidyl-prolyl cis-trans isomerase FkpA